MSQAEFTEHTMRSWDGKELFYRAWRPAVPSNRALLLFHRGHEHSGRMVELVRDLGLDEFHVFAWDARGHGRSPGERGYAENVGVIERDIEAFVRHVSRECGVSLENIAVLAHSVGAVGVAAWVHDYAPPIRAMVLATPAFRVKLYVPLALPVLRLKNRFFGRGTVKSYVKARMLTHDPDQARAYAADPLIFRQIADNLLIDLFDTSTRVVEDAGAITVPTLLMVGDADWVVKVPTQQRFFERLASPIKQFDWLPGFYHAVFHETHRRLPIAIAREFIREMFEQPPQRPSLLRADRRGHTKLEYDHLTRRSRNPLWPIMRLGVRIGSSFSKGLELGRRSGFDSGVTLDYVYANRPQGLTRLGEFIDRCYLNSIGWRGIRQRKVHLEKFLSETIDRVHRERKLVRILDIAAGVGRYVLETMARMREVPIRAVLRDYKEENLAEARRLAGELNIQDVVIEKGDAFDRASLAAVSPPPTIAIISGLYELFSSNEPVLRSLGGLADAMTEGGYLIYTNQPWHPQVEFIARVLNNREGRPWVMRRRTQAEMDELARAAGFEKLAMEIDPWGIFSASLAERRR